MTLCVLGWGRPLSKPLRKSERTTGFSLDPGQGAVGWPSYLRRTPPRREALRHSGGESRRWTSPTVTLYLDVELSRESRPGTEQKTSLGFMMPPTKLSLASERAERLLALEGMGTVEQKREQGRETLSTGQLGCERAAEVPAASQHRVSPSQRDSGVQVPPSQLRQGGPRAGWGWVSHGPRWYLVH